MSRIAMDRFNDLQRQGFMKAPKAQKLTAKDRKAAEAAALARQAQVDASWNRQLAEWAAEDAKAGV